MSKVICFDLYNTLVYENAKDILVNFYSGESEQAIEMDIPSYLDYFVEQYGEKYSLTTEEVYSFVRDRLMTGKEESFEVMTKMLFSLFVPNEPCTTRKTNSVANNVEFYWRVGSECAEWIDKSFPAKLEKLRASGNKIVLITNCTFPAWQKVNTKFGFETRFDACYVSCLKGKSKPDVKVWSMVESWFRKTPRGDFVMIGDREIDDLVVPRARGWTAIHADDMSSILSKEKE